MEKKNKTNRYSLNFGKAHEKIVEWCEYQTNFSDAIKYLIEEEMKKNGIRNLQEYIPSVRSIPAGIKKVSNIETEVPEEPTAQEVRVIERAEQAQAVEEQTEPEQAQKETPKRGRPPKDKVEAKNEVKSKKVNFYKDH